MRLIRATLVLAACAATLGIATPASAEPEDVLACILQAEPYGPGLIGVPILSPTPEDPFNVGSCQKIA